MAALSLLASKPLGSHGGDLRVDFLIGDLGKSGFGIQPPLFAHAGAGIGQLQIPVLGRQIAESRDQEISRTLLTGQKYRLPTRNGLECLHPACSKLP